MLTVYDVNGGGLLQPGDSGGIAGPNAIWIDMLNPTDAEDAAVETALKIDVPTRSEMREIEASNRFYVENDAVYMTAIVLHNSSAGVPTLSPVTFILSGRRLITVRYAEPKAFELYVARAGKLGNGCGTGAEVMIGLIEMLIAREADLIERVQDDADGMAPAVFGQKSAGQTSRNRRLDVLLRNVGKAGDIVSRAQESAVSMNRMINYAVGALKARDANPTVIGRAESAGVDIASLTESLRSLSNRISFLLDATLGMISTEQNQIIKLFSVMAVILMPPTLIASVYGMNFKFMPELEWIYGYPFALVLMVLAAILPYVFFRAKGWF